MIQYHCPVCKKENTLQINFDAVDYICVSCGNLIHVKENKSKGVIKKPVEDVVLEVGQSGTINHKSYTVTAVVVKKYGASTFWREYYLKDSENNNAFLSESNGHWVLLFPQGKPHKDFKWYADYNGKKYRWYETTPCSFYAAKGFFEDRFVNKLMTYKEFVNGAEMISYEESGNEKEFYWGIHVPKIVIKKNFNVPAMPSQTGVGIVQPFYYSIQQMINILGITALLICSIQLIILISRKNTTVFEQTINFKEIKDKEYISQPFVLSGGSAPLKVKVSSNVDNSWASTELSLVNQETNEVTYTTQDLEYYHGYEDGERWSEGSQDKEFNFCGVAPGTYHFAIAAEKEEIAVNPTALTYYFPERTITFQPDGTIDVLYYNNGSIKKFENFQKFEEDTVSANALRKEFIAKGIEMENNMPKTETTKDENPTIKIVAKWLPVTAWNFLIVLLVLIVFIIGSYYGRHLFEKSKWSNSTNTPYPETES